jgi:signal transduction histidine kinase
VFLLARLESGDIELIPETIDLTEIVDEAMEIFRPLAGARDISLRLESYDRGLATGSTEAVARVVRNLLDNAVRHSPPGGGVVVSLTNGCTADCTIIDEGAGFSSEFLATAFDRFTRHDASRMRDGGGAGLGLAIARSYLAALGGEISAEPGPGGRVSFRLPGSAEASVDGDAGPEARQSGSGQGPHLDPRSA